MSTNGHGANSSGQVPATLVEALGGLVGPGEAQEAADDLAEVLYSRIVSEAVVALPRPMRTLGAMLAGQATSSFARARRLAGLGRAGSADHRRAEASFERAATLLLDEIHRAGVDRAAEVWAARASLAAMLDALDRAELGHEATLRVKRLIAERADVHFTD